MNFTRHARGFHSTFLEIERTLPKKASSEATVFFAGSISLSLSLSLSLELYCFVSLSQKYQKSQIALQRARADPGDPYNPPLMWGSRSLWKGCPVFILRRWEDISIF